MTTTTTILFAPKSREVRLHRFNLAALAYTACLPLLGLAHLLGFMSLFGALSTIAAVLVANAMFLYLFHTGLNERFEDPSLTWPQVVVGTAIILYAAYHADANRGLALMLTLVVLTFGTFRFNTREFMVASGMILAGYAAVINLLFWRKPEMVNVLIEGFQWVVLSIVLPCYALVGGRLSELRERLRRANGELSSALTAIQQMATHDTLTGLPNRALFSESLGRSIALAERGQRRLALFFLDLDRFKNINDTLGHSVGDRVLKEAARRLRGAVRTADLVARLGGDEFVILVHDYDEHTSLGETAARVLAAFAPTMTLDGQELGLAVSIGICTYPDDGKDAQVLVSNADIAMYRAKGEGRNRFCFYSAEMNTLSQERLSLEAGLRHALERGEIEIFYQPKIDFGHGRATGVEALIRWRHPELGFLSPDRFVPLAEETGAIIPIGYWTLQKVCERSRRWQEQGIHLPVAVNLAASQFHDPALLPSLAAIFRASGVSPELLEIEITETMVMKNIDRAVAVMEELRRMGVRIAIDDFGTGHSSLGYLKRFPINQLKVDRSFVRDLPHNGDDVAITRAVIAMAHSLEMSVVAEGVEHQEQFDLLRAEGCDEFQGFYCRPAMPEAELLQFLMEERANRPTVTPRTSLATAD